MTATLTRSFFRTTLCSAILFCAVAPQLEAAPVFGNELQAMNSELVAAKSARVWLNAAKKPVPEIDWGARVRLMWNLRKTFLNQQPRPSKAEWLEYLVLLDGGLIDLANASRVPLQGKDLELWNRLLKMADSAESNFGTLLIWLQFTRENHPDRYTGRAWTFASEDSDQSQYRDAYDFKTLWSVLLFDALEAEKIVRKSELDFYKSIFSEHWLNSRFRFVAQSGTENFKPIRRSRLASLCAPILVRLGL